MEPVADAFFSSSKHLGYVLVPLTVAMAVRNSQNGTHHTHLWLAVFLSVIPFILCQIFSTFAGLGGKGVDDSFGHYVASIGVMIASGFALRFIGPAATGTDSFIWFVAGASASWCVHYAVIVLQGLRSPDRWVG